MKIDIDGLMGMARGLVVLVASALVLAALADMFVDIPRFRISADDLVRYAISAGVVYWMTGGKFK